MQCKEANRKESVMKKDRPAARQTKRDERDVRDVRDEERGPLGHHPVGTGVGAVAGGVAAGAAVGSVAGPIGAAVGGAIGAAAGGLAGKGIADVIDPTMEDEYWRGNWQNRSYIDGGFTYDQDYGPAYRYGWQAYPRYRQRSFDEVEGELGAGWMEARGGSRLDWERARPATRDAWERIGEQVERAIPGDRDNDGR
jgi:hypothetical protein